MSLERAIWNDGQGLATPDLQRPANDAGSADDRAHEVLLTPGAVQKKILPLTEESATSGANGFTGNPRQLAVPSTVGLTPAGMAGGVRVLSCELIAGSPTSAQQIALAGTLVAPLDTTAITANSSGSIRYDLIYATLVRGVSVTGTRKIKSATDGSLSSQTVNLADTPTITLGVNVGFLTGATAPTITQINAALPADTAPSSSTFGSFNFVIGYVTVANGYSAGTTLFQNSAGGTTYIVQAWSGGWVQPQRMRSSRSMSLYYGAAAERPGGALQSQVQLAERWGSGVSTFVHFQLLSGTGTTTGTGVIIDNTIDWRRRHIECAFHLLSSAANVAFPLESFTTESSDQAAGTVLSGFWSGAGSSGGNGATFAYTSGSLVLTVNASGNLVMYRVTGPANGANGDAILVYIRATDQFLTGM